MTVPASEPHLVVALKYRPGSFESLVGQAHIATALGNAIRQQRVGHAYLFTGARGVGKTSSARIFAKCLNCEQGPTPEPCQECEACQAISVGEDVDVIEIDGASNRGIDEIRQLRANASIRPSRSSHKIYIIDEVHMLTKEAFNALLKTLEEPPAHVKFIFCTTDPEKIPITVLSRCQRFDFSPVPTSEIAERLRMIAGREGVEVDEEALNLLARRANGSMRDSQSLLEQMLSFCEGRISADQVHQLLGTADLSRIADIARAMAAHDPAATLNQIHEAMRDGVDAGQLASQLLGYYRDLMAVRVGSQEETLLMCAASDLPELQQLSAQYGLETILAIVQILDGALVRMQSSLHGRTLLEAAAVRICHLEHLDSMSDLVAALGDSGSGSAGKPTPKPGQRSKVPMKQVEVSAPVKKNETLTAEPAPPRENVPPPNAVPTPEVFRPTTAPSAPPASTATEADPVAADKPSAPVATAAPSAPAEDVEAIWSSLLAQLDGDLTADMASDYEAVHWGEGNSLVVTLRDNVHREFCSKPERKQNFENQLESMTGKRIRIDFLASEKSSDAKPNQPKMTRVQQIRKLEENPFVAQALDLFEAEISGFRRTSNRGPG